VRESAALVITFDSASARFNYRVVGIALHAGRVLLHCAETDDFWTLPGGRGEMHEPAAHTLVREMREELKTEITIERLVWVVENFFDYDSKHYHELVFYFLMSSPPDSPLYNHGASFHGYDGNLHLIFEWQPLIALEHLSLYPAFLIRGLPNLPSGIEHIVHIDDK